LLSGCLHPGDPDYFLLGLLSLIDAILGMPMPEVLLRVPIDHEIKAALLGQPSPLRPLYDLVLAQENADWKRHSDLAAQLHLAESDIARAYLESVLWAREVASL
jgi:EAL and modified HD-GYP domain-containing signal transduction protein